MNSATQVITPSPSAPDARVRVNFVGGPYDGQNKAYVRNPRIIGCVTDAHAAGMHGVYQTPKETWRADCDEELTATWQEMPPPQQH